MNGNNIEEMRSLIKEMLEYECNIGSDLNYLQAIMDGSWPTSVRQLTEALDKAKEIHKDEIVEEIEKKLDRRVS